MSNNPTPTITPALQNQVRKLHKKCVAQGVSCLMFFQDSGNSWMLANGDPKAIGEALVKGCVATPEYTVILQQVLATMIQKQS